MYECMYIYIYVYIIVVISCIYNLAWRREILFDVSSSKLQRRDLSRMKIARYSPRAPGHKPTAYLLSIHAS